MRPKVRQLSLWPSTGVGDRSHAARCRIDVSPLPLKVHAPTVDTGVALASSSTRLLRVCSSDRMKRCRETAVVDGFSRCWRVPGVH